ncbi:MAG: NAD(P)H-quinone oxidoreductase subunit F, partial [Cyanobacteria bacterium P01_F01_bin.33]
IMGGSSVGIGLVGITIAVLMYLRYQVNPASIAQKYPALYRFSLNKWYFDDLYDKVFVRGTRFIAREALEVDQRIIDGLVNLAGLVTVISGEALKYVQTGRGQLYALVMFASAMLIVAISGL